MKGEISDIANVQRNGDLRQRIGTWTGSGVVHKYREVHNNGGRCAHNCTVHKAGDVGKLPCLSMSR